ncbi:methenyltetrahydrofolate synthase domain-containing protein-like [Diadema antillarum]|uniref:methenyltetrahydrofolate synthase domain-containing protein-like n=1 Tax=Diadema antillarum TaxID=105358 RepID=UPI003A83EB7F
MDLISKESIRQKIWNYLEENDIAAFPRPVHHRIPNFKGAAAACDRLQSMEIFRKARTVKVNPDKPQQQARFMALEARKTLLVPTPRLKSGLFNRIDPPHGANKNMLRTCSSSQGVRQYSTPIGLKAEVKVELVIIGSVAVSPTGLRIGKGEGYADMEFAMMSSMGAVTQETVVVTTVHDCQVLDDMPEHLFGEHDLSVDYILTPTRTIQCDNQRVKPKGIAWHLLSKEKFSEIPILRILRKEEAERGVDVRLKEEVQHVQEGGVVDSGQAFCADDPHDLSATKEKTSSRIAGRESSEPRGRSERLKSSHQQYSHETRQDEKKRGLKSYHSSDRFTDHDDLGISVSNGDGEDRGGHNRLSGQRSKGSKSASGRRRDLGGMFAWNQPGGNSRGGGWR